MPRWPGRKLLEPAIEAEIEKIKAMRAEVEGEVEAMQRLIAELNAPPPTPEERSAAANDLQRLLEELQ